jgi:hypothetical protein
MYQIFILSVLISCFSFAAEVANVKIIKSGKKEVVSCPERNTHLFCNVSETFDTPGICGHGFDCIMMKSGEKETVCSVIFECVK